jgi:hypothetical protein
MEQTTKNAVESEATEIWWLETMAAEKKRYLVVTTAGNIMAEGFDILDATLIINHQMGSKGILAVVEQDSDGEKHLGRREG